MCCDVAICIPLADSILKTSPSLCAFNPRKSIPREKRRQAVCLHAQRGPVMMGMVKLAVVRFEYHIWRRSRPSCRHMSWGNLRESVLHIIYRGKTIPAPWKCPGTPFGRPSANPLCHENPGARRPVEENRNCIPGRNVKRPRGAPRRIACGTTGTRTARSYSRRCHRPKCTTNMATCGNTDYNSGSRPHRFVGTAARNLHSRRSTCMDTGRSTCYGGPMEHQYSRSDL